MPTLPDMAKVVEPMTDVLEAKTPEERNRSDVVALVVVPNVVTGVNGKAEVICEGVA